MTWADDRMGGGKSMLCNGCGKPLTKDERGFCIACSENRWGPEKEAEQKAQTEPVYQQEGDFKLSSLQLQLLSLLGVSVFILFHTIIFYGQGLGTLSILLLFSGNALALFAAFTFLLLWIGMIMDEPITGLIFFLYPRALGMFIRENWERVKATCLVGGICAALGVGVTFLGLPSVPDSERDLFLERSYVANYLGYGRPAISVEIEHSYDDYDY